MKQARLARVHVHSSPLGWIAVFLFFATCLVFFLMAPATFAAPSAPTPTAQPPTPTNTAVPLTETPAPATATATPIPGALTDTPVPATATPVYSITLASDSTAKPVGLVHTVTAIVVDQQDRPAADFSVVFNVTGTNTLLHRVLTTDSNGRVVFSYPGIINASASDTITAWVDLDHNDQQGSTEPFATATANWRKIRIGIHGDGAGNETEVVRTVIATVTTDDAEQQRIPGLAVGFTVTGGNSVTPPTQETDPQGQTVFTYTSEAPPVQSMHARTIRATDTITAWVDLNRDNLFTNGEPYAVIDVVSAITLASFTAQFAGDQVILNWRTAIEIDTTGFNLYRATVSNGLYVKINEQLIGAQGNGTGASYTFVDTPPGNDPCFYKLEDIDYNGVSTMHGSIAIRTGLPNGDALIWLYMPFVQR